MPDSEQSSKENVESSPHDGSGSDEEQENESPSSTMEEANMSGLECNKDDDEDIHDNESLSELSDDMPLVCIFNFSSIFLHILISFTSY